MKASEVTSKNLREVDAYQAYEWIKTGVWTRAQFTDWFDLRCEIAYEQGQTNMQEAFLG